MAALIFAVILFILLVAGIVLVFKPIKLVTEDYRGEATDRTIFTKIAAGTIAALAAVTLAFMSVTQVGATQVGVPITLGKPGGELSPGPHVILPWTSVKTLDVKTQIVNLDDDNEVKTITSDRIQVPVDASVYFSVDKSDAATLLLTVGEDYVSKIVSPLARSTIYDEGSRFSSENIQNQREAYETAVEDVLKPALAKRGIVLEKVELRKFQIPENILSNATAKINAEEDQKRTAIAAETQRIEALGKAKANKIVADSLEQNPTIICSNFVDGLRKGEIKGPIYVNPCGGDSNGPNLLIQTPPN